MLARLFTVAILATTLSASSALAESTYVPAPNFRDGSFERPGMEGLRFVLIWVRTSNERLLTTARIDDKVEIKNLNETLPEGQEQSVMKVTNELPDVSAAQATAGRIRKLEGVKDVRLVFQFTRYKQDKGTPAHIAAALVVDCETGYEDVCGESTPRVLLQPTTGEFSIAGAKLSEEIIRLEAALKKNIEGINMSDAARAKKKKDLEAKRARAKNGLDKF